MEKTGKEDLYQQGTEDDKQDVPKDVEASAEVEHTDVARVSDGEAEEVNKV